MNAAISRLADVVDDAYLLSIDRVRDVLDVVEGDDSPYAGNFQVDLDTQTYTFIGRETLEAKLHFIGSAAPGPKSWVWGWHNINGFPDAAVASSGQVREFGERFGLSELTSTEVPLLSEPRIDARVYGAVAGLICGGLPTYLVPVGGGSVATMLLDAPQFAPGAPSIIRAATVLPEAAQDGVISDWRRALGAYAQRRGFRHDAQPDGSVDLSAADGALTCTFDDQNRLTNISMKAQRPE
ncbi:MAG: DUF6882 domain-containing protein [Propionibacteriaceae bacterium]